MLTFIPWVLLVLQKIESSGLDCHCGGTLPGLCQGQYQKCPPRKTNKEVIILY